MQTFSDINAARAANKGKVIIWYPFQLGGMLADRWMWQAEQSGEVLDYDRKAALLAQYKGAVLLTLKRDGSVSAQQSVQRTATTPRKTGAKSEVANAIKTRRR